MLDLEKVYNFHPFYGEFREQKFDAYLQQTFIRFEDLAKIEIALIDGIVITPESFAGSDFSFKKVKVIDGKEVEVLRKPTVSLSYIGINKDEFKRQGRGTELLEWFVGICDKYDYKCQLEMDTQFNTPIKVLEKFYTKAGFIRTGVEDMVRPCKSDRDKSYETKMFKENLALLSGVHESIDDIYRLYVEWDFDDEEEAEVFFKRYNNYTKYLRRTISECILEIESQSTVSYVTLYKLLSCLKSIVRHLDGLEEQISNSDYISDIEEFIDILSKELKVE